MRGAREKVLRIEAVLEAGPYVAGERFRLVGAAFAPAWRHFET